MHSSLYPYGERTLARVHRGQWLNPLGHKGRPRGRSKCTKFDQLILRKIIKIAATRRHIIRLKMHKIRFRLELRPRPRWELTALLQTPSWIKVLLLRAREESGGEEEEGTFKVY